MTDVKADAGPPGAGPAYAGPVMAGAEQSGPVESEPVESGPVERIHWLQRSMAGPATLLMAAMTAFFATSPLGMVLLLPLGAIAWTLFVRERDAFRTLCALRKALTAIPGAGPLEDCGTGDRD
ncbi:hypothetical protein ACFVX6_07480 [Streptomyces sp. NPDC058289]|uniref:hypothetical protein n=1 Tax=Streptomyces sp. NPDC058289 TaxID=3346425 RepID=UPI0036EE6DC6